MSADSLIARISAASNKYGDKLVDFMARYGLFALKDASPEQLEEYIKMEGIA